MSNQPFFKDQPIVILHVLAGRGRYPSGHVLLSTHGERPMPSFRLLLGSPWELLRCAGRSQPCYTFHMKKPLVLIYPYTNHMLKPQPLAEVGVQLMLLFLQCYIWVFLHLCVLIREPHGKPSRSFVMSSNSLPCSPKDSPFPGLCSIALASTLYTSRLFIVSQKGKNADSSQVAVVEVSQRPSPRAEGREHANEHLLIWGWVCTLMNIWTCTINWCFY